MSLTGIKRKHKSIEASTNVFDDDKKNFMVNINSEDDGDSSDPDSSDIEDDDDEKNGENEVIDESDSLDEDHLEDVSGDEEEESDDGTESEEDSEEENKENGKEEEINGIESQNDGDKNILRKAPGEAWSKMDSDKKITGKAVGEAESKVDRDSGVEDLSHGEVKQAKVKKKSETKPSKEKGGTCEKAPERWDEYEEDSSDEEDLRNTIGNVPLKWYDEYPHLGYDLDGKQIVKPKRGDTLDNLLNRLENPDYNRTVFDKQTGQDVRLSDKDLDVVKRVMKSRIPDGDMDMYAPWIDHFTHEVMEMPLSGRPEHKRSFIPCQHEAAYVAKRAEQIKRALDKITLKKNHFKWKMKQRKKGNAKQIEAKRKLQKERKGRLRNENYYDIWKEGSVRRGIRSHLAPPKFKLPGHSESYNPPPEYIGSNSERYTCVRRIPGYSMFLHDRYERCLDLYIAPRKKVMRITANSKDLLPVLPKAQDLQPFPSREGLVYKGHRSIIRTISVHPLGKYLASGSDDHTVKIWEIDTGRCLRSFSVEAAVKCVAWNPSGKLFLLAVVVENNVVFLNPETYLMDKLVVQQTNVIFSEAPDQGDFIQVERVKTAVTWRKPTSDEWAKGYRIVMEHFKSVKEVVWHKQGDYFATVIPDGDHRSVLMHQLSRWRSQVPFNRCKGRVQCVKFHPKLPFLFVATQSHIRVYNLQKQRILKKVQANCRWVSCLAIHPGGEHFLIGGYDRKVNWFEMEYTKRPLVLRYHKEAVRSVVYHRKYPLFASACDEGRVIVSHGMVYNDWLKDPFLVPLKELHGHQKFHSLFVLDLAWHPYEAYIFTAGADATIRLWHP